MPTSSQEPRGTGLSSTLVSDFRTILNSLEKEKASRGDDGAGTQTLTAALPPGTPLGAALRTARPAESSAPRSLGDVRSRIAALGDLDDVLSSRSGAPAATPEPAPATSAEPAAPARRRGFGTAVRQPADAEAARRKRSASTDVITWQRVGLLAVFVAVVGGGAVLLQSLAAREEAKVAADVIGNAAVASVAPSAPLPDTPNVAALAPVRQIADAAPTPAASSALANTEPTNVIPPVLRNSAAPFDATSDTTGAVAVTAFAAPEPVADPMPAPPEAAPVAPADAAPVETAAAPKPAALPKEVPLPPVRAPERQAVAAATPAPAAEPAETVDEADSATGFGGDPVGTVVTRRPVTMRAAPKKGASPIGNLSAGQKVELVACQQWCEIIVDGKRGFVFKSFVDTSGLASAQTEAQGAAAAQ